MKPTIKLPDAVLRQAETLPATRDGTLKRFSTEALEVQLRHCTNDQPVGNSWPPWMAGFGVLSNLSVENRRILDVIEDEFETLPSHDLA